MTGMTVFERMSAIAHGGADPAKLARWLVPQPSPVIRPIAPLPTVDGGWACIEADVPWHYEVWAEPETEEQKRASRAPGYDTMSLEEIAAMPVRQVAARDCHLWFWVTGPFIVRGDHIPIIESWGFHVSSTGFVWVKLLKGMEAAQYQLMTMADLMEMLVVNTGTGLTTRKNVEVCVLARRGSPKRKATDVHEVIIAPRREHSRKPEEAYERIERYCDGPRLQLFGRQPRAGWTVWGNEAGKFAG